MKFFFSLVLLLNTTTTLASNKLKLYFFPSPDDYNWSSPQKLARSVIKNTLLPSKYDYRAAIGHVAVELKCGDNYHALTGMSMKNKKEDDQLILKDKIGLGILFYPMEGKLQDEYEIRRDINERMGTKDISWIEYRINDLACHRLRTYLTIYRNENLDNVYGLVFNPRKKEGAGCSAFATSFMQIAGILSDEHYLNWSRNIHTNKDLNAYNGTAHRVSIFKMAMGINSSNWAKNSNNSIPLFFWEPNLMHKWVKRSYKLEQEHNAGVYQLEKVGHSIGLRYDARLSIPDLGPLFYGP